MSSRSRQVLPVESKVKAMAARSRQVIPVAVEAYRDDGDGDDVRDDDDEPLLNLVLNPGPGVQRTKWILPEVPTFLYFISIATQLPLQQFWLYDHFSNEFNHVKKNQTQDICQGNRSRMVNISDNDAIENKIQTLTNDYVMYTGFVSSSAAILPTLLFGTLTDKFGRRFVFFTCLLGTMAAQVLMLVVFLLDLSPDFLYLVALMQGLSGSFGLFLAAVFGMGADITAGGKKRGFRVAVLEAVIAISVSVGMIVSGVWVKKMGYVWPMGVSVGELVLGFLYVVFFIPETRVPSGRVDNSLCKILASSVLLFCRETPQKRRFKLVVTLLVFMVFGAASGGEQNFSMLFLLHRPFCWDKDTITIFFGVLTLVKWFLVMTFIFSAKRFVSEPVFALIGILSLTAGYLIKGFAFSNLFIYISAGVSLLSELVSPMCRTIMSRVVSGDEQGALFAGIGVFQMVVAAVSGLSMSLVYKAGLTVLLGLPYFVLTGLASIGAFLLVALIVHFKRNPDQKRGPEVETIINC